MNGYDNDDIKSSTNMTVARDRQPLDVATSELAERLNELSMNLEELFDKIGAVLSPIYEVKEPSMAANGEKPAVSPMLMYFVDETNRVLNMSARVREITHRVEC